MKKIIYKILRWPEKIIYKIFREEIDEEVYENMNEIYSKFIKIQIKRLKEEENEKIFSNLPNNKFKGYYKNNFYKQNDNGRNI